MNSNWGLEVYPVDFEEPPSYLKSKLFLILWYINPDVRRIITEPEWAEKISNGKMPHMCLHQGFCRYYDTREDLEDHYAEHPEHRLTKQDHDSFKADSQLVQYLRQWNFPLAKSKRRDASDQERPESPPTCSSDELMEEDGEAKSPPPKELSDDGEIEEPEEKKQCGFCLEKMSPKVYNRHKKKLWKRCPVFKTVG